jgi:hypothetical protein
VTYRPVLTVRAAAQFADLSMQQEIYQAFMDWLVQLAGAPWDAWLVPSCRQTPDPENRNYAPVMLG